MTVHFIVVLRQVRETSGIFKAFELDPTIEHHLNYSVIRVVLTPHTIRSGYAKIDRSGNRR